MMFDWSLAQDEWSDEQKNVWVDIKQMWRNFDYTNWSIIENSLEWKNFANQSIISTFNNFASDTTRIKEWQLIKLFMAMFPEFDVYSHNFNNGAKIVFGRKEQNTSTGRVWFIIERNHQYRRLFISGSIAGNTDHLNIELENFQNIPNTIVELLKKSNTNNQTYGYTLAQLLKKYPIPNTRKRNLPMQFNEDMLSEWTWSIINQELANCNTWEAITGSNVWQAGFAGTAGDNVFNKIEVATRLRIWHLMCEVATEYDLDIYSHGNAKIIAGRKSPDSTKGTVAFAITDDSFKRGPTEKSEIIGFAEIQSANDLKNWIDSLAQKHNWKNLAFFRDTTRPDKTIYLPSDFGNNTNEGDSQETDTSNSITNLPQHPLNVIFYGPPGTGKTYTTVTQALKIVAPEYYAQFKNDREKLKTHFDALKKQGKIFFCTFHQSFSYEDFIEGIRANTEDGQIEYKIEDGIFKKICNAAKGQTDYKPFFSASLERFYQKLDEADGRLTLNTSSGNEFDVEYHGKSTFSIYPKSNQTLKAPYRASLENIENLYVTGNKAGIYNPSYVQGILSYMQQECGLQDFTTISSTVNQPYVLIIDEINRGNISRIFGELITLIEDSKRAGADEALDTILPYSKTTFSVPQNVYIIGTMNTADRSLAGLDLALRRRFTFEEMRPKTELLKGINVEGIKIDELLSIMNQRIEVLLDREHTIGHAYFMELKGEPSIKKLGEIFQNKILPLLQEYFFDDWEKINSVLGENGFISKRDVDKRLFKVKNSTDEKNKDENSLNEKTMTIWQINTGAFAEKQKYVDIYQIAKITP